MPLKTDRNVLKQYFRSGSRPTQKQFHDLIDACYNSAEGLSSFVSGYAVLVDVDTDQPIRTLRREAGKTILVPSFERINLRHVRVYHYAFPACNVGPGMVLEKILLEVSLPQSTDYLVRDRSKDVRITQEVSLESIRVFNGSEALYSGSSELEWTDSVVEIPINKTADRWMGISLDIAVAYDIRSNIAVSDQLDIAAEKESMLEHTFGNAGCVFLASE